jgi:hypothetical protein
MPNRIIPNNNVFKAVRTIAAIANDTPPTVSWPDAERFDAASCDYLLFYWDGTTPAGTITVTPWYLDGNNPAGPKFVPGVAVTAVAPNVITKIACNRASNAALIVSAAGSAGGTDIQIRAYGLSE